MHPLIYFLGLYLFINTFPVCNLCSLSYIQVTQEFFFQFNASNNVLVTSASAHEQKALLQENPSVFKLICRPVHIGLYNGCKTFAYDIVVNL